jgi:hypothetical protein
MIGRREALVGAFYVGSTKQAAAAQRGAAALSGASGDAAFVTFRGNFANAPARSVQSKLRDTVSVCDALAGGSNEPADKTRIQTLSDAITPGKTLDVPVGQYAFRNGGLEQRRAHSWAFDASALFRGDYDAGNFDALLTIRIGVAGGASEFRGGSLSGGIFLVRNPSYVPGVSVFADQFARGGFAIEINATGAAANVINYRICQASIVGGRGAVHFIGTDAGQTIAWSGIEKSTIINGVVAERTADGLVFRDNIADGIAPAYTFDLIQGAFCCTIDGGTTGNRHGALDLVNGSLWRVTNCQMEHSAAFAGEDAADATIIVRGLAYPSHLGIIRQNNFGAGIGRVRNTILLQNAKGTVIDENYFFLSDEADIRIESAATDTIVGARNMARGKRAIRPTGTYTDVTRRLVVALPLDGAGKRAVGTRGIWHPATEVLSEFCNGWRPDGLEILLTEQGLVAFNGGLSGGTPSGILCTFPFWLRPHQDAYLHATVVDDGSIRALRLDAESGALSIVGALTGTTVNLSNASFMAILNLPYSRGP